MKSLNLFLLLVCPFMARSANVIERLSVQDGAICDDRIPAYLVVDSHKVVGSDNKVTYKDVDEAECKNMCTDNKDSQGNQVMCSSYTYNIKDKSCSVHRGKALPTGKLEMKPASGFRYYEKFCLPEGTSAECGEKPFFRADQAVLIGFAKNVSHTKHLATCIQACIEMSAECRSAMFFGRAGECILSVASAQDAPDVFAEEEDEENVVYFENGCVLGNQIRSQKKHSVPKQKELNNLSSSVKLANNSGDAKSPNGSISGGVDTEDKEGKEAKEKEMKEKEAKEKEAKETEDKEASGEKKTSNSAEEDGATARPRKTEKSESIEAGEASTGDSGAGDGSQERESPKRKSSKQKVESAGRKAGKGGSSSSSTKLLQTASVSNGGDGGAWGPWSDECRSFDERRPCQNGNRVGFQSRQCLRTPFECQGPFFRYCIAPCNAS